MDAGEHERIERFLSHLHVERRMSGHTVAAYRHDLRALASFCARRDVRRWSSLNNFQVRAFAAAEHAGGIAPRSIQRRLSAVRSFYEYLIREGHAKSNPALEVRAPKTKKRLPATLDADQMARLLDFRADDSLSVRDKAMMELFYSSGLRLSELVGLDVAAVDLKDRTVRVLGKGNKTRIVPVGRHAIEALKRLTARRSGSRRRARLWASNKASSREKRSASGGLSRPSRRTSPSIVRPFTRRVKSTAPITSATRVSRSGNAGRLNTMASATAPRKPPQKITAR